MNEKTKKRGGEASGIFTTNFYLSVDSVYQAASDTLIGSRTILTLLNGTSNVGSSSVTIPLGKAAGTYYIIARADGGDSVVETLETNNTKSYRIVVVQ